jgi:hypothetical protein
MSEKLPLPKARTSDSFEFVFDLWNMPVMEIELFNVFTLSVLSLTWTSHYFRNATGEVPRILTHLHMGLLSIYCIEII